MPVRIRVNNNEVNVDLGTLPTGERNLSSVKQIFMTQGDERVRPTHAALHKTVWDADDPNAPTPPLGPGCRCWLEFVDDGKGETGLSKPPTKPPEPGDEALKGFWKDAEQSEKSEDPGAKVTPKDTFGNARGIQIEEGNIKPEEAFDPDTGDVRPAGDVTDIGKAKEDGRSKASVFSGFAVLDTFVISSSQKALIIRQAKDLLKQKPTLKDEQALFDVTMRLRPGLVGARSPVTTRKNARKVARAIRKANGPL